jgi:hypothetical protein
MEDWAYLVGQVNLELQPLHFSKVECNSICDKWQETNVNIPKSYIIVTF